MPRDQALLEATSLTTPKPKTALVADLFCGAGGSSTGAKRALSELGYRMNLVCVNHWDTAIDTHTKNHPEARHYCADVSAVRPHIAVPEGRLDLLMASPTCTFHSRARGGKPVSDQQRMDPWHIIGWLTELKVDRLLVENVPEFVKWGPVSPRTGKPIKSKEGEYFDRWVETICNLGGRFDHRFLNCADYGDATTRERWFGQARFDRVKITWPEASHAKRGKVIDLFAAGRKPWRAAREIIDWNVRGRSIFNRPIPLSPRTLERILAGAIKLRWPELYIVAIEAAALIPSLEWALRRAHAAVARGARGAEGKRAEKMIAYGEPRLRQLRRKHINGIKVNMPAGAEPMAVVLRRHMDGRSLGEPLPTLTTGGHVALAEPFILKQHFRRDAQSVEEPVPTITSVARVGMVEPFVMSGHAGGAPRSIEEPMPGMTGANNGPLVVEPFVLNRHGDNGGYCRATSPDDPLPTVTASGGPYMVEPLIAPYYGSGSGLTCQGVSEPVPTVTTKGRFGLVLPVTHDCASNRARDVDTDPLHTITTAHRGELAFVVAAFGEREGQAPRVHDLGEPCPTICAQGRIQLVEPGRDFDVHFRMFEPHELARAMGFDDAEQRYEFAGTKTDVIRQIGNAVPVGTASALVRAMFAS